MAKDKDLLKKEQRLEKQEYNQSSNKKKGFITSVLTGGVVALALGLGLGIGLASDYKFYMSSDVESATFKSNIETTDGKKVTIEAENVVGYKFKYWNYNGSQITANPYTFELNKDTAGEYEAVYEEVNLSLSVSINGEVSTIEVPYGENVVEYLKSQFVDYNEYNTCGWFKDSNFIYGIDTSTTMTEEITELYTKSATLNKLNFQKSGESFIVTKGYTSCTGDVVIPSYYKQGDVGYPVTKLANNAFEETNISSITLSNSITSIGEGSFYYCFNLKSVNIPYGITELGKEVFYECDELISIIIPESVQTIGDSCFQWCIGLNEITIPANVTKIDRFAFSDCYSLDNLLLPEKLTYIGDYAFRSCDSLTSLDIPASLESIGTTIFDDCYNLVEIYNYSDVSISSVQGDADIKVIYTKEQLTGERPASRVQTIDSIKYYVYENDFIALAPTESRKTLSSVTLDSRTTELNPWIFAECDNLTNIELPNGLKKIGLCAFWYAGLTSINIPDSVTIIDDQAFCKTNLKTAAIPNTITHIGYMAFLGTTFLNSLTTGIYTCSDGDTKYLLEIPNSVKTMDLTGVKLIASGVGSVLEDIETIVIPNSVQYIGEYAFSGCDKLKSIEVAGDNEYYASVDGVLYNKDKTILMQYPRRKTDSTFYVPSTVVQINYRAFYYCSYIENIIIPSSITILEDYSFEATYNLTTATIESAYVYNNSFVYNTALKRYLVHKSCLFEYPTTIHVLASIVDDSNNGNAYLNDTSKYSKSAKVTIGEKEYYTFTKIS